MSTPDHSRFSASAAAQWLACPASVPLTENLPEDSSEFASEGTAAHAVAESCLMLDSDAVEFVGHVVEGQTVTAETAEAVQVFVDLVREIMAENSDSVLSLERRIETDEYGDTFGGTVDATVVSEAAKRRTVLDYKHGVGIAVDVEENTQLLSYGLLTAEPGETVELIICQPRGFHPDGSIRRWTVPENRLALFAEQVRNGITASSDLAAKLASGETPDTLIDELKTGSHCRFCKLLATCPAQLARAKHARTVDYVPPGNMAAVLEVFEQRAEIKQHLAAMEKHLYGLASGGGVVPGHKLVAATARNRAWLDDEAETMRRLRSWGVGKRDATEPKLKSPAAMEKLCKVKPKLTTERLSMLWHKPAGQPQLVPESDGRPALIVSTPEDDFSDVAEASAVDDLLS